MKDRITRPALIISCVLFGLACASAVGVFFGSLSWVGNTFGLLGFGGWVLTVVAIGAGTTAYVNLRKRITS